MTDLQALLWDTTAELHPDLAPWVDDDGGPFGPALKHPLVIEVMYHPHRNAMINAQYEAKLRALEEAEDQGHWTTYIYLHERPYRLKAFTDILHYLDCETYWKLLGGIWTDSENIWQNYDEWREILADGAPGREHMMSEEDREDLAELPDELTVYRGWNGDGTDEGLSWTLNKAKARWFAKRFEHRGVARISTGTVAKADVLAYHTGRSESEIVVFPENVLNQKVELA